MPPPLNYLEVTPDANPYPPPQQPKTLLHTLSALNTQERDESVVDAIEAALQNHNRVLVV